MLLIQGKALGRRGKAHVRKHFLTPRYLRDYLRILGEMLVHWDMKPTAATGGREALEAMERAQQTGEPFPLVVIDCVRLSNRFAGPLHRLRRDMRRLAAGEIVEPIHFRDDDLWREFADEFNAVARRMELLAQTSENADALTESLPIGAAKAPQTAR